MRILGQIALVPIAFAAMVLRGPDDGPVRRRGYDNGLTRLNELVEAE